jgi:hypothetical protein
VIRLKTPERDFHQTGDFNRDGSNPGEVKKSSRRNPGMERSETVVPLVGISVRKEAIPRQPLKRRGSIGRSRKLPKWMFPGSGFISDKERSFDDISPLTD